jgi:hypothetical protein
VCHIRTFPPPAQNRLRKLYHFYAWCGGKLSGYSRGKRMVDESCERRAKSQRLGGSKSQRPKWHVYVNPPQAGYRRGFCGLRDPSQGLSYAIATQHYSSAVNDCQRRAGGP